MVLYTLPRPGQPLITSNVQGGESALGSALSSDGLSPAANHTPAFRRINEEKGKDATSLFYINNPCFFSLNNLIREKAETLKNAFNVFKLLFIS